MHVLVKVIIFFSNQNLINPNIFFCDCINIFKKRLLDFFYKHIYRIFSVDVDIQILFVLITKFAWNLIKVIRNETRTRKLYLFENFRCYYLYNTKIYTIWTVLFNYLSFIFFNLKELLQLFWNFLLNFILFSHDFLSVTISNID